MFGAAEKAGSGVDKIMKGWALQHWRSPFPREQMQPDRVYWQLPMVSLFPPESVSRLEGFFGEKFKSFPPLEVQALLAADLEGAVDNARMRQITGAHATDITRALQGLVAKGALVQEGQARGSRYRLPVEICKANSIDGSVHKEIDSVHNGSSSVHKEVDSIHTQYAGNIEMTQEVEALLRKIAAPAVEKKRLSNIEIEQIIQKLCDGRWLTRNQIATFLNRNPDGVRSRFLSSMVRHRILRLRFPDKPNRADQAYISETHVVIRFPKRSRKMEEKDLPSWMQAIRNDS